MRAQTLPQGGVVSEGRAEASLLGLRWGICGYPLSPHKEQKVNLGGTTQHVQKDRKCSL